MTADTKHTAGPWQWRINRKNKAVELLTVGRGGTYIMGFERWGTQGAAPCFRVDGLMVRADELAVDFPGQEHNASWLATIDHPDARLIAAAPLMLEALEALLVASKRWKKMGLDGCPQCDFCRGFAPPTWSHEHIEHRESCPVGSAVSAIAAARGVKP